ncbi:hypothetical protein FRZ00_30645 [Streptomyces mobaraensis]|uniref:Uncharacterized protein n=1 Tax=Streptomyces mobaraensis TaxID=35621 RepID=A0A5N5VYV2_STRMB|nr:hypothetical protein FRZ00_30645 [Streptomyces mobaraensis]
MVRALLCPGPALSPFLVGASPRTPEAPCGLSQRGLGAQPPGNGERVGRGRNYRRPEYEAWSSYESVPA